MLLFGGGLLHVCSVRESFRPTWISISSGVVPFVLGSLQIVLVLELFAQLLYGAYRFLAFSPTILDVHSQSHKGWHLTFLAAVLLVIEESPWERCWTSSCSHSEQQAFPPHSFESSVRASWHLLLSFLGNGYILLLSPPTWYRAPYPRIPRLSLSEACLCRR